MKFLETNVKVPIRIGRLILHPLLEDRGAQDHVVHEVRALRSICELRVRKLGFVDSEFLGNCPMDLRIPLIESKARLLI